MYKPLVKNLIMLRTKAGLTQQKVADALDIDRSTYTYYESGKTEPSLSNLKKIADLYKVDFNTLLL